MPEPLSMGKRIFFWTLIVLVVAACMELFAMIICRRVIPARVIHRTAFRSAQDYIGAYKEARRKIAEQAAVTKEAKETQGQSGIKMFHPVLGWDYPPGVEYTDPAGVAYRHGPLGERRTCTSFSNDLIATYGDSFTYCSDVEDCHTWQTCLGEMIEKNVLNFGVAGYGTDQAYLKYELNAPGVVTPVVMLCILPDNINRVVNVFRTFYAFDDRLALTKPRYVRQGEGFALIPNPLGSAGDVLRLEDPAFVAKLGAQDYWYEKDMNRPPFGFPYIITLIRWRATILHYLIFNSGLSRKGSNRPFYPNNLFEEAEPLAIMCHIVDLFVHTARARSSTPVIVLMPHRELIEETLKHRVSRIANLATYLDAKGYPYIDLIKAMADMHPSRRQLSQWYREHATPEGNRITAQLIAEYLRNKELLHPVSSVR